MSNEQIGMANAAAQNDEIRNQKLESSPNDEC
ncbi:hypothetical protein BH09PLA1_BH09PLA1_09620 [soil metagenome]